MHSFLTQVLGLWFRRCSGGGEFLLHVAPVPGPTRMTPEVSQRETVQSQHGDGNPADSQRCCERQLRMKTFFDFH